MLFAKCVFVESADGFPEEIKRRPLLPLSGAVGPHPVEQLSGVGGRDAETSPGLDDGRGGESHHHHADVPLQHLPTERPGGTKHEDTGSQYRHQQA